MARRWNTDQEIYYSDQLKYLYITKNKTIFEIAAILNISKSTVYDRLIRLKIDPIPYKKKGYLNKRENIEIPQYSDSLAEFFGIMLGDGKLSHFQVAITLGNKEFQYALYVSKLINELFKISPKIIEDKNKGYRVVYFGSVEISMWLKNEGLVYNKVKSQVNIPGWIFDKESYVKACIRGFFDTDGSIYKLKYGNQLSFTNFSLPLLMSLQCLLRRLGYKVSEISGPRFYITRKNDIERFFKEIHPMNSRHIQRFELFKKNK